MSDDIEALKKDYEATLAAIRVWKYSYGGPSYHDTFEASKDAEEAYEKALKISSGMSTGHEEMKKHVYKGVKL